MAASYREFLTALYEEHLEEASFLYLQRRGLLGDPMTPWRKVAEWEDRLEAHIDALVIGGDLALEICRAHVTSGDAGEVFAAIAVFCRQESAPLLAEALRLLDAGNAEMMQAADDALLVAALETAKAYRADGHASVYGMLRSMLGWSERECRQADN